MRRFVTFILVITLCGSLLAQRQETLYKAFLHSDMLAWHEWIVACNDTALTQNEIDKHTMKADIYYNYLAWATTQQQVDTDSLLSQYNDLIVSWQSAEHDTSLVMTHLSAYHAYMATQKKISRVRHAYDALKYLPSDTTMNPFVQMHIGYMYFYRPRWAGGNKEKALLYLQQAIESYQAQGDTVYNWNYRNAQMHIAQCLWKLGNKKEAIAYTNSVLAQEPNFKYLRDDLLPQISGQ